MTLLLPRFSSLSGWPTFHGARLDPSTSGRPYFTNLGENRLFARIIAENAAGKLLWAATFRDRRDAWKYWKALTSGEAYLPDHLPIWDPGPLPYGEPILWAYVNHSGFTSSGTFTVPAYWYNRSNMAEGVGSGGSAGAVFIAGFAGCCTPVFFSPGGGGGAAYAANLNASFTVGQGVAVVVASGPSGSTGTAGTNGSFSGLDGLMIAVGGQGGVASGTAAGGLAGSCTGNSTKTSGGSGSTATALNVGQGGGGTGGPNGNGNPGSSSAGGSGDAGHGGAPNGGTGTEWQGGGTGFGSGAGGFQGGSGGQFGAGGGSGNFGASGGGGNQGAVLVSWTQFTFVSGGFS